MLTLEGQSEVPANFISTSAGVADADKGVKTNASGLLDTSFIDGVKFGGSGADGALAISSGVTNFDLAGASYFEKNYTSISITGTASITFTNPATNGTIISFKSQGAVTITSSANPAVNVSGAGSSAGTTGISTNGLTAVSNATAPTFNSYTSTLWQTASKVGKYFPVGVGNGGIDGTSGAGIGGRGGGAFIIECAGAFNVTSSMTAVGLAGANASGSGSGGGGGGGGFFLFIYKTLTASSGTYTVTGGAGGSVIGGVGGNGGNTFVNTGASGGATGGVGATGLAVGLVNTISN